MNGEMKKALHPVGLEHMTSPLQGVHSTTVLQPLRIKLNSQLHLCEMGTIKLNTASQI